MSKKEGHYSFAFLKFAQNARLKDAIKNSTGPMLGLDDSGVGFIVALPEGGSRPATLADAEAELKFRSGE